MDTCLALRLEERLSELEGELRRIDTPQIPSSERDALKATMEDVRKLIRRWVSWWRKTEIYDVAIDEVSFRMHVSRPQPDYCLSRRPPGCGPTLAVADHCISHPVSQFRDAASVGRRLNWSSINPLTLVIHEISSFRVAEYSGN